MGDAYNESYVEFGSRRQANFCNLVFTAWDFNITDSKTAKLKRAHIRTNLEVSWLPGMAFPAFYWVNISP